MLSEPDWPLLESAPAKLHQLKQPVLLLQPIAAVELNASASKLRKHLRDSEWANGSVFGPSDHHLGAAAIVQFFEARFWQGTRGLGLNGNATPLTRLAGGLKVGASPQAQPACMYYNNALVASPQVFELGIDQLVDHMQPLPADRSPVKRKNSLVRRDELQRGPRNSSSTVTVTAVSEERKSHSCTFDL